MRLLRPTAASCVTVSGTLSIHVLHVTPTARRSVHRHKIVEALEATADWRENTGTCSIPQYLPTYIYLSMKKMFRISRRRFHWKTAPPQISHRQLFSSFRYMYASKTDLTRPLLEEETLDCYSPDQFYPVAVGEVLNSSYRVVGKLGYGAQATVWLCRDVRWVRYDWQ